MDLSGAPGVLVLAAWLVLIVVVAGLLSRRLRRRAFRRGTYPLRLLPWYLGGPPKIDLDLPGEQRSSRDRSRHP